MNGVQERGQKMNATQNERYSASGFAGNAHHTQEDVTVIVDEKNPGQFFEIHTYVTGVVTTCACCDRASRATTRVRHSTGRKVSLDPNCAWLAVMTGTIYDLLRLN